MSAIVRLNPMREVLSFQDDVSRLFGDVLGRRFLTEEGATSLWQPPVDIEELPDKYSIHVELPGIKLEDIKITVEDNRLVIRGEKTRFEERKGATHHRVERVFGSFERVVSLTHALKPEKIEAIYKDGVLEVSIPKAEEAKAREIMIKVAK